jgi:hypothetical protein
MTWMLSCTIRWTSTTLSWSSGWSIWTLMLSRIRVSSKSLLSLLT